MKAYFVTAMDCRNSRRLKAKNATPMAATARNCGQTVSIPAPRKMMACEKATKCRDGRSSVSRCIQMGWLSTGVLPPESSWSTITTRMIKSCELGHGAGDSPQVKAERSGEEKIEHDPGEEKRQRSGDRHIKKGANH